jgi:hypothetical protein
MLFYAALCTTLHVYAYFQELHKNQMIKFKEIRRTNGTNPPDILCCLVIVVTVCMMLLDLLLSCCCRRTGPGPWRHSIPGGVP